MKSRNATLVYSSDRGRICPDCGKPAERCACRKAQSRPAGDGIVRVGRATKGRKGKGVTVVTGIPLPDTELQELAQQLKRRCGAGGTVKDGTIEIQGEHRDLLVEVLTQQGYTVKRSGG